jgi:GT2 family glycosyltransferase
MAPKTSIIVLAHNNWRETRTCLSALKKYTAVGSYEVLVYDQASQDDTWTRLESWSKSWPELKAVRNKKNLSFAAAVNRGMRASRSEFIVWLNNDARPCEGWLSEMIAIMRDYPSAAAVGPLTDHMAPPGQVNPKLSVPRRARDSAFLGGFCFLMRRSAIASIGMLDERFVWGWEDMDYCLRLRQAGLRLLLAERVFVQHVGSKSIRKMPRKERVASDLANRRLFLNKWHHKEPFAEDVRELFRRTGADWDHFLPKVSIIVPEGDGQARTLGALRKYKPKVRHEVLIVSSSQKDASGVPWAEARHLCVGARGAVSQINSAMRVALGNYAVVLRPGVVAPKGWLRALLKKIEANEQIGAVGALHARSIFPWQRAKRAPQDISPKPVRFLDEMCLLIPRYAQLSVGALDERLPGGLWAVDYSIRLRQAGFHLQTSVEVPVSAPRGRENVWGTLLRKWLRSSPFGNELKKLLRNEMSGRTQYAASIVIVHRGSRSQLRRCLQAVRRCSPAGSYEVVVIGKPGADYEEFKRAPEGHARLRVVEGINKARYSKALNHALQAARGTHLLLLSDSAGVTPGWLEQLITVAEKNPRALLVGPSSSGTHLAWQKRVPPRSASANVLGRFAAGLRDEPAQRVWYLHGICLLLKRDALWKVGAFDEGLDFDYFATDYCLRIWQSGSEVVLARAAFVQGKLRADDRKPSEGALNLMAKWPSHPAFKTPPIEPCLQD